MSTPALDRAGPVRDGEDLDPERLSAWLSANVDGVSASDSIEVTQFPGGHSNLTYLVRVGDRELVLRRPPFGSTVKTAHDMGREHRVLSALSSVWPLAPTPVAFCDDHDVLGADFYLTERRSGVIYRRKPPAGIELHPDRMRRLSEGLVDVLVQLHGLDTEAAGLPDLGRPDGYVQRQVSGWTDRYRAAKTDDLDDVEPVASWLADHLPTSPPPTMLHNDFKFDNVMFDAESGERPVAVFDWEMSTRGDPLMDLGTALSYWVEARDAPAVQMARMGPTHLDGCLTRQEAAERYASKSGRSIDELPFYAAFGLFKTAVVCQQIYFRFKQGKTHDPRFAGMIEVTKVLLARAHETVRTGEI